jgi:hypothetical protein
MFKVKRVDLHQISFVINHFWESGDKFDPVSGLETEYLNPWSSPLLEKLVVSQLSQETGRMFWNPKVHYHAHKSLSLDPSLSHMNTVQNSVEQRPSWEAISRSPVKKFLTFMEYVSSLSRSLVPDTDTNRN